MSEISPSPAQPAVRRGAGQVMLDDLERDYQSLRARAQEIRVYL